MEADDMFKKWICVFLALLLANTVYAANLIKGSYGNWYGFYETISISKKGIDNHAHTVDCGGGVKSKMLQKTVTYSGKELIGRINEAIEFGDDSQSLKEVKLMIQPNKKYHAIEVLPPVCGDGMAAFVQLNAKTGLYIETAPDDAFYVIKKP